MDEIHAKIRRERQEKFIESDQLSLGEMIERLEKMSEEALERVVVYDFGHFYPQKLMSWRGIYAELALDYVDNQKTNPLKGKEFLELLKEAVGKEFEGYKGGEFRMSKDTPVWVANWSHSGHTAVSDIVDCGYHVVIMTKYMES